MWKVAALAWMPVNAVMFGAFVVVIAHMPWLTGDMMAGGSAILLAAGVSLVTAMPIALWVARRMVTPEDRRALRAEGCDGSRPDCRCCHAHAHP